MARFNRLLLTGAAGNLGRQLRTGLRHLTERYRLTDIAQIDGVEPHEEAVQCDLGDELQVRALLQEVDAVLHFGGIAGESNFGEIANANIHGLYNLYEGCRRNNVKRVIFASSNHAIGFYPRGQTIDGDVTHRPDTLYGVSKAFGENISRYFFDKYEIETVCLRIGSCFPKPIDRRMLATWLSYPDLLRLVESALLAPVVGHMICYGVSNNREMLWDNRTASSIGYQPQDCAEDYRAEVEAITENPEPTDDAVRYQGGGYTVLRHEDF
ncbi:MAG: NAD(P)-dependent oxidoreductase [Gammaproteobacteria bacterium]|nr:NAD(P)-dependent oxidoreductase [Gammaproteobacteria bacterium]